MAGISAAYCSGVLYSQEMPSNIDLLNFSNEFSEIEFTVIRTGRKKNSEFTVIYPNQVHSHKTFSLSLFLRKLVCPLLVQIFSQ